MNAPLIRGLAPLALWLSLSAHAAPPQAWPAPIQALEAQGYEVLSSFPGPSGLTGYAALYLGRPQAVYLTPDGRQAIVGNVTDARGDKWKPELLDRQFGAALWRQLESSHWIADGKDGAPRVIYTFTDPNCPYCRQLWRDARPWVQAGKVQIRHILVGLLAEDSPAKAAALLAAPDPAAALARHEAGDSVRPLAKPPAAVGAKLAVNQRLMERFGVFATPASFYRDAQGRLQKIQGAPAAAALQQLLGPR
ncbi:thiol:disulfide interchange protein DsbG [Chromobacterium sp. S0633]|uniref:thiol:disulfide interchange protein DsbG n=1 Tax=Chromobacterium sp. S0633 TaxID=2957805 RepID=UPI00209F8CC8|nr:thiol:disulfide interchange protein DsbG [Chromobacterium sp. S0633]MCP1291131.1 thiol:disulfide interchange protein DsbG [Chromobacterium sp. S0633]